MFGCSSLYEIHEFASSIAALYLETLLKSLYFDGIRLLGAERLGKEPNAIVFRTNVSNLHIYKNKAIMYNKMFCT
jgi:hypothetical protein